MINRVKFIFQIEGEMMISKIIFIQLMSVNIRYIIISFNRDD